MLLKLMFIFTYKKTEVKFAKDYALSNGASQFL